MRRLGAFLWIFLCGPLAAAVPGSFFADGKPGSQAVALTFDDGPGGFTREVLDLLDREGVKATFFMSGDQVEIRPAVAREVQKRGHLVADHTYSHVNFYAFEKAHGPEAAREKIRSEMKLSQAAIIKALGTKPEFCRMPNGFSKSYARAVAKEFGYTLVNWTFGEDWQSLSEEKMLSDYLKHVRPGAILLFHDGGKDRTKTVHILPKIIAEAKKKKLSFLTVKEIGE